MKFEELETLEAYLGLVEAELLKEERQQPVAYPKEDTSPWNSSELESKNSELLDLVSGSANIYAIFTAPKGSNEYSLRYIGKSTRKLARQRVRNRLFKKHEATGSKLSSVIQHVESGGSIKISWLTIKPESLRNYLEEELIQKNKSANWNRENAKQTI
ncbi:hypothetical protein [Pseudomonas sp. CFBP 5748]